MRELSICEICNIPIAILNSFLFIFFFFLLFLSYHCSNVFVSCNLFFTKIF